MDALLTTVRDFNLRYNHVYACVEFETTCLNTRQRRNSDRELASVLVKRISDDRTLARSSWTSSEEALVWWLEGIERGTMAMDSSAFRKFLLEMEERKKRVLGTEYKNEV